MSISTSSCGSVSPDQAKRRPPPSRSTTTQVYGTSSSNPVGAASMRVWVHTLPLPRVLHEFDSPRSYIRDSRPGEERSDSHRLVHRLPMRYPFRRCTAKSSTLVKGTKLTLPNQLNMAAS